jgi:uncharacterized protein (TIGR02147 family)
MGPVFDYRDYKGFLKDNFPVTGAGRGKRAQLAQALRCQSAFVSQVLNGDVHFSFEHMVEIARFLQLPSEESAFLLLLAHHARAGSSALRELYQGQIEAVLKQREIVKNRMKLQEGLKEEQQAHYYKSWVPAALHIALSIPRLRTPEAIARRLRLPLNVVQETLSFLLDSGLAVQTENGYRIGATRIHLGTDSPLLPSHHTNWRMQAIQSFAKKSKSDLHYSGVVSLSHEDREKIREILLSALEKSEQILKDSPEEELFCLTMDFFEV